LAFSSRIRGREIPPQLVFLAEDEGRMAAVAIGAFPRDIAETRAAPPGGVEQAGEHLRVVVLPARWAPETHEFAGLDGEVDVAYGHGLLVWR